MTYTNHTKTFILIQLKARLIFKMFKEKFIKMSMEDFLKEKFICWVCKKEKTKNESGKMNLNGSMETCRDCVRIEDLESLPLWIAKLKGFAKSKQMDRRIKEAEEELKELKNECKREGNC